MATKKADKNAKKDGAQQAGNLPLFYKNPVPLDAKKHAKLGLKPFDFSFANEVNAVPVNLVEMPQICHFYPIAFSPDDNGTPVAILGLRDTENLFVEDNAWAAATYIPAYVRRYPFIFSEVPGTEKLTLCVDESSDVTQEGGDQPFFDKDGKGTPLSENALEFCKSYHAAAQQTVEFGKALVAAGLLIEREAQISISDNQRINFSGFRIIDEKKFAELDDKTFLEFRQKGYLPFIYAHLFSGAQWQNLTRRLNERLADKAA